MDIEHPHGGCRPLASYIKESPVQLSPYLLFDGQCHEAFRFYRDVLGGEIEAVMTHCESPICDDVPFECYERFGLVTDRFGIPWIINGGLADSNAETNREANQCAS